MRSAVIYYSFSGNTKKVAEVLAEYLQKKYAVDTFPLQALDEANSFFVQAARAFRRKRAKLASINLDLSEYDLVCFGTPVWAFGPAPAMNTYLEQCFGLEGKKAVVFTTYGSGAGNNRCLDYMQKKLAEKGVRQCERFSLQQLKTNDKDFIWAKIGEAGVFLL